MTKHKGQTDFTRFLVLKFFSWQQGLGRRATLTEFADYLDLDRAQLYLYMNGHTLPKKEVADRIAKKLGCEIYDLLNLERPDPLLVRITEFIEDADNRKLVQAFLDLDSDAQRGVLDQMESSRLPG